VTRRSGEGFFRVFTLRPDKGFLMMVTAAPKALVKTLTGLTEGEPSAMSTDDIQ